MSDQAKIETISDENGKTIGQRRHNPDSSQDIRMLDHKGEYTNWELEARVIPEEPVELPIEVGTDLDPVALLDEGRINEKTYDKMMAYIKTMNALKNDDDSVDTVGLLGATEQRRALYEDMAGKREDELYGTAEQLQKEMEEAELIEGGDMLPEPEEEEPPLDAYMHTPGAKDDENKLRAGLVLGGFSNALTEVCRVGTYGAEKYSENGWMHVPDGKNRYKDAAMRHLLEHMGGVMFNYEDGNVRHLAQVCWNLLAVLEFEIAEEQADQVEAEFGEPE